MKKLFVLGAICSIALLSACGNSDNSGGASTGSSSSSSSSVGPTILSTISGTVTNTAPTISLANVATVDFTGQPSLIGSSVRISQQVDENLNGIADDQLGELGADHADEKTIRIESTSEPDGPVKLTLHINDAVNGASGSAIVGIFAYSTGESFDSYDTLVPLSSTSDVATGTVSTIIPAYLFQQLGTGSFVVTLKLGILKSSASTSSARAIKALSTTAYSAAGNSTAITAPIVQIPCPLPSTGCVETSRFNPFRLLPNYGKKPHWGVDFEASSPIPVIVPPGGKVDRYVLPSEYTSYYGKKCELLYKGAEKVKCDNANSAGIMLVINYGTYALKLMHLSNIDASMLNADKTINSSAITKLGVPVARTGQTGIAVSRGPHLHMELYTANNSNCRVQSGVRSCSIGQDRIDAFPYIATNFVVSEMSNPVKTKLKKGTNYTFGVRATDIDNINVSSAVNNAFENGGVPPPSQKKGNVYDPTRKICLNAFPDTTLKFTDSDSRTIFDGAESTHCFPWSKVTEGSDGRLLTVRDSHNRPVANSIMAIGLLDAPKTSVVASYSFDPSVSTKLDPQVSTGASIDLLTENVTANVNVQPATIAVGGSATVTWSSTNATSCVESGSWTGGQTSGSLTVSPTVVGTYNYVLTCQGPGGPAVSSATLSVQSASAPIYTNCGVDTLSFADGSLNVWANCTRPSVTTNMIFEQEMSLHANATDKEYNLILNESILVGEEKADVVLNCKVNLTSSGSQNFQVACNSVAAELYPWSFGAGPKTGRKLALKGVVKYSDLPPTLAYYKVQWQVIQ